MIIIVFVIIFILISVLIAGWSSAPFVPTRKEDLPRILKLANLQKGQTFYDLGCGNGRVVLYVAKNTKASAVGVEMAAPIYLWAKMRQIFSGKQNLKIILRNFFKVDLSKIDVAYIFGYPTTLKQKVAKKLQQELKPGAKVISYAFEIPGWQPILVDKPSKEKIAIFVYKK